jgi:hypothetical protein
MEFKSSRWDIAGLINHPNSLPSDRLFGLVLLWKGRASDNRDRLRADGTLDETSLAATRAYTHCADELIAALDVIYPGWRDEGMVKLVPDQEA